MAVGNERATRSQGIAVRWPQSVASGSTMVDHRCVAAAPRCHHRRPAPESQGSDATATQHRRDSGSRAGAGDGGIQSIGAVCRHRIGRAGGGPNAEGSVLPEHRVPPALSDGVLNSRPGLLDNLVIVTGQSQCSGPAIDSALLARDYAPVANLLGTVATGVLGRFPPAPNRPPASAAAGGSANAAEAAQRSAKVERQLLPDSELAQPIPTDTQPLAIRPPSDTANSLTSDDG